MAGLIPEEEGTDAGQAPETGERGREIAPAAQPCHKWCPQLEARNPKTLAVAAAVIIVVISRETLWLAFLSWKMNFLARARNRLRAVDSPRPWDMPLGTAAPSCSPPQTGAYFPYQVKFRSCSSLSPASQLPAHLGLTLHAEGTHLKQSATCLSTLLASLGAGVWLSLNSHCAQRNHKLLGTWAWVSMPSFITPPLFFPRLMMPIWTHSRIQSVSGHWEI